MSVPEVVWRVLSTRTSVRLFREDPVPVEVLKRVVEAGTRAPTAGGMEQWYFIIVHTPEIREKLYDLIVKAHLKYYREVRRDENRARVLEERVRTEKILWAPAYIAAYLDFRRRWLSEEWRDFEYVMALESISAAIENMILYAWSLGLGTCWFGVPLLMEEEFNRLLQPPENTKLAGILAVGYPRTEVKPKSRRPLDEVLKVL